MGYATGFEHPFLENYRLLRACIIYGPTTKKRGPRWVKVRTSAVYVSDLYDATGFVWIDGRIWRAESRPASTSIDEDEDCWYMVEPVNLPAPEALSA